MDINDKTVAQLNHRLPKTTIPSHYRLYIDASKLEQFIFQGNVDIDIQV